MTGVGPSIPVTWQAACQSVEPAHADDGGINTVSIDPATASPQALLDQWLLGRTAKEEDDPRESPFDRLVRQAKQDVAFRQSLVQRFVTEQDAQNRQQIAAVLGAAVGHDMARMAGELLQGFDPGRRQRGIQLMASIQGQADPVLRQAVVDMLASEKDPATLAMAMAALQPGDARDPQQIDGMLSRLSQLARHEAPLVRAAAIEATARWGRAAAEPSVLQGLTDNDPAVLQAGIDAAGQPGLQTPAMADALLAVAERGDMGLSLRQRALDTLAEMNLDATRYGRFAQLHRALIAPGG